MFQMCCLCLSKKRFYFLFFYLRHVDKKQLQFNIKKKYSCTVLGEKGGPESLYKVLSHH